jgi:hypothetical protein
MSTRGNAETRRFEVAESADGVKTNYRLLFVVGGLIFLMIGAFAGYLYGVNSTSTRTTSPVAASTAYDQVSDSFAKHIFLLSSRNASAIASQYEQNANVTWFGGGYYSIFLLGNYNGTKDILFLMNSSFIGHGDSFTLGNVTRHIVNVSDNSATVESSFVFFGQKSFFGTASIGSVNGTISAQDFYVYSAANSAWLISQETWNFTSFNSGIPMLVKNP